MTREEILQQITMLDKQINDEIAKTKLPSLDTRHQKFPISSWISVIVLIAIGLVGPQYVAMIEPYALYVLIAGALAALFALYSTLMWLKNKFKTTDKNYQQATSKVQELQDKKAALQKQLNNM